MFARIMNGWTQARGAALLLAALLPIGVMAQEGYRLPPAELQAIVDAPQAPQPYLSPGQDLLAFVQSPALPGIDVVAQPELRLGGLRINPRLSARSRFSFGSDVWLQSIDDPDAQPIGGLPQPLALADLAWSPDQRHLAFSHVDTAAGAVELWVVDVSARRARRLVEQPLNTVSGPGFAWFPDSSGLLVTLRVPGAAPEPPAVPDGPTILETASAGAVTTVRTYQDLLGNAHDADVFEHYLRSQAARVTLNGRVATLGEPDLYIDLSLSPDGRWLLGQAIERPFSYVVPFTRFPRRIDVRDSGNGRVVHGVARLPVVEGLPPGNDSVATGVRQIGWRADADATLVWAEAQDGGNAAVEAAVRDAVFTHAAPFSSAPRRLIDLGSRYAGATWSSGELALVHERWWRNRWTRTWQMAPDAPEPAPALLFDHSYQDRYADPGTPVTVADARGRQRLLLSDDGAGIYLIGAGASDAGDQPFVDRLDLATGDTARLFQSQAPAYEQPLAVLGRDGSRLLTSRESPNEPPNLYLRALGGDAGEPFALTRYPHPLPALAGVTKEQIRYRRADGVELSANLYLPPGYDPARDGPLPLLMWAYPREFVSAQAASQVIGSPYRFNRIDHWGPLAYLARGYAVLDGPTMPIVGEGDAEPNDTYIEQLVASAQAAVDEVVRRGVAARDRIAVGGHSYGGFMTVNLLAHSDLFRTGIARSGAYNRSLTPFGFQAEERNYWQAQETYLRMSPFNYADRIQAPVLIIHGAADNNSGTFPIQSERLYAAINGLGGTARLVMLPAESHRYVARESVLHMLYETDAWLEKHLKADR